MQLRALILDFGEVLVRKQPRALVQQMAARAGLDEREFERRYWLHRHDYDRGALSGTDYWMNVSAARSDGIIEDLKTLDYLSWTDYREDVWALAAEFRARGGLTAVLSNGVPEVMARVSVERRLTDRFDAVIVSYEIGCTKPDEQIYRLCLERLSVPAAAALFVDDRIENIDGAARLGIQTLHFTGDDSVAELRRLIS